jgi:hypothetical protein
MSLQSSQSSNESHDSHSSHSSLSPFDRIKRRNQTSYDALSREHNKLYLGQPTYIGPNTIKEYDEDVFDGQLINESCVLQVIEHGKYNDIDLLKHNVNSSFLSKRRHFPLDVPVIHISGRIGHDSYMMPDEQIEETVPIINELQYNSLLRPINRKKQIQKVSHKLRLLHKKYLKVQIQEMKDKMETETNAEIEEQYKHAISLLKQEIKEIYGYFNPYSFKAGQKMNKYLTLFEGPDAPEEGRVRGIFGPDGQEYFHSYVEKYGCYEDEYDGVPFKTIHLGDFIHYCYETMERVPKYFIIVDHSCSSVGFGIRDQMSPTKFTKNFYNKHLSVQKRSFSKKVSKSRSKLYTRSL